jgi:hypothetical protein
MPCPSSPVFHGQPLSVVLGFFTSEPPSVLGHPVDFEDPSSLAAHELVLKLPNTAGVSCRMTHWSLAVPSMVLQMACPRQQSPPRYFAGDGGARCALLEFHRLFPEVIGTVRAQPVLRASVGRRILDPIRGLEALPGQPAADGLSGGGSLGIHGDHRKLFRQGPAGAVRRVSCQPGVLGGVALGALLPLRIEARAAHRGLAVNVTDSNFVPLKVNALFAHAKVFHQRPFLTNSDSRWSFPASKLRWGAWNGGFT